jgi:hypothetical protein
MLLKSVESSSSTETCIKKAISNSQAVCLRLGSNNPVSELPTRKKKSVNVQQEPWTMAQEIQR